MKKIITLVLILVIFHDIVIANDNSELLKQKISIIQGEWKLIDKFSIYPWQGLGHYKNKNVIIQDYSVTIVLSPEKKVSFDILYSDIYKDRSDVDFVTASYELLLADILSGKNNIYSDIVSSEHKNNNYVERIVIYGSDKSFMLEPLYNFIILDKDKLLMNHHYILERVK